MATAGRRIKILVTLIASGMLMSACGSQPSIATDVTYCCVAETPGIHTYRIEFRDMPEFLKPMLRDSVSIVLDGKGLEYTEGDAHAVLTMTYVDRTMAAEETARDEAWETIAPAGGVRFIAEVQMEMLNSVTRERIWAGSMGRVHNVYEGSYMHDEPAKAAMRNAFLEMFADYPDARMITE
jgi:hypothetical protein